MRYLAFLLISGFLLVSPVAFADMAAARSGSAISPEHVVTPAPVLVVAQGRQPLVNWPALSWPNTYVVVPGVDLWLPAVVLTGHDQIDDFTNAIVTLGRNLALNVHGRVELVQAEIGFGDATTQVIDFRGLRLNSGVFRLIGSDDLRVVESVHLKVRGVTSGATIRVGVQP